MNWPAMTAAPVATCMQASATLERLSTSSVSGNATDNTVNPAARTAQMRTPSARTRSSTHSAPAPAINGTIDAPITAAIGRSDAVFSPLRTIWIGVPARAIKKMANFGEATAALGLTAAEGQALHHLDEPAPMRAMADSLCCDASYITVLADKLVARGLVQRAADPDDRRVKRLVLTDAGRAMRNDLVASIHATTPALTGLDAADRAALIDLLRKLAAVPLIPS